MNKLKQHCFKEYLYVVECYIDRFMQTYDVYGDMVTFSCNWSTKISSTIIHSVVTSDEQDDGQEKSAYIASCSWTVLMPFNTCGPISLLGIMFDLVLEDR
jgi:hypothetical protein